MSDKDRQSTSADPAESLDPATRKERFLARWSRRKTSALVEQEAQPVAAEVADETSQCPVVAPTRIAEKTDADMPPIESLDADSDYAQFLSPGVSEQLRRAALRKLFHQPRYNVMDGLDTYIADLRSFTPLGDTITADMRHQMERLAEAARDALEQQADVAATKGKDPVASATVATGEQSAQRATLEPGKESPDQAARSEGPDSSQGTAS